MSAQSDAEFPDAEYLILSSRLIPDRDGGYALATLARARQMAAAGVHDGLGPLLLTLDPGTPAEHARHRATFAGRDLVVDPARMRNLFDEAADPHGGAAAWLRAAAHPGRAGPRAGVPADPGCRGQTRRRPAGDHGRSRLAHHDRAGRGVRRDAGRSPASWTASARSTAPGWSTSSTGCARVTPTARSSSSASPASSASCSPAGTTRRCASSTRSTPSTSSRPFTPDAPMNSLWSSVVHPRRALRRGAVADRSAARRRRGPLRRARRCTSSFRNAVPAAASVTPARRPRPGPDRHAEPARPRQAHRPRDPRARAGRAIGPARDARHLRRRPGARRSCSGSSTSSASDAHVVLRGLTDDPGRVLERGIRVPLDVRVRGAGAVDRRGARARLPGRRVRRAVRPARHARAGRGMLVPDGDVDALAADARRAAHRHRAARAAHRRGGRSVARAVQPDHAMAALAAGRRATCSRGRHGEL